MPAQTIRLILLALLFVVGLPVPAEGGCNRVSIPVALTEGEAPDERVGGSLCLGGEPVQRLQVLVPGASYGLTYWDFGFRYPRYSYADAMRKAGEATLAIDPLGRQTSTKPSPGQLTFDANVYALHQVVEAARAGELPGGRPARIVVVGHSLGSAMALVEAARYGDVDGLIVSGFLPHAIPAGAPQTLTSFMPAQMEPRLADRPVGYITTRPGARELFYAPDNSRPQTLDHDERTKDTLGIEEGIGNLQAGDPAVDDEIDVPILLAIGDFDRVFCAGSCVEHVAAERSHYANSPSVETYLLPRAGHSMNLHENARRWFAVAADWLEETQLRPTAG